MFFAVLVLPVMLAVNSLTQIDLGEISASFDQWLAGIAQDLSSVTIFGTTVDLSPIVDAINEATTDQEPSGQLAECHRRDDQRDALASLVSPSWYSDSLCSPC